MHARFLHKPNKITMKLRYLRPLLILLFVLFSFSAYAQFEEPELKKVTPEQREWFQNEFRDIKWTGQGLYGSTAIDDVKTDELRARLQAAFGEPTQKLEDLINQKNFRPGKAIQFEYWFTVNDSIPMMILDVDGPFGRGLVYGGASRYVDLMPQIKRTLSRRLMEIKSLAAFQDYFYSPEREQWYSVTYKDDELNTEPIKSPQGMSVDF